MAVKKGSVVFHAPVLHQFFAGLHSYINSRVLDGLRVDLRIFPRDLIAQALSIEVADAFSDM